MKEEGRLRERFQECQLEAEDEAGRTDNLLVRLEQQFDIDDQV
jgi:hypothetical protein